MRDNHHLKVLVLAILMFAMPADVPAQPASLLPEQVSMHALDKGSPGIEGTWRLEVTPYICGTDTNLPAFAALVTYAQGGTVAGVGNSPHFLPGQRTSEFGVWRHTAGRRYEAAREAFILFPSPPPGLVRGTQRIEENVVVKGDTLLSEAISQLVDESGAVRMAGCARIVGQRMATR